MIIKTHSQPINKDLIVLLLILGICLLGSFHIIHHDKAYGINPYQPTVADGNSHIVGLNTDGTMIAADRDVVLESWDLNGPPVYVNATANGSNNGTNWAHAYTNLRQAIENTGSPCQIWVAAGEYTPALPGSPGQQTDSFRMKNGIEIYGGFPNTGNPTWKDRDREANPTILTGDIGIPLNNTDNCYHVFYHPESMVLDNTAILDGFIISDGNASGTWHEDHPHGGGMFNRQNASPSISNCTFMQNSAEWDGGGMFNWNSRPDLTNCHFASNDASWGGGMYNLNDDPRITGCIFSDNIADNHGGGMYNSYSNPVLLDCAFSDNQAGSNGGGICNDNADPELSGCSFSENAADSGGGMCNISSSPIIDSCELTQNTADSGAAIANTDDSSAQITDCDFNQNTANAEGGAIVNKQSSPAIIDCTFSLNTAIEGGGIHNSAGSAPDITGCTFTENTAPLGGGLLNHTDTSPIITNCNFWYNSGSHGGGAFSYGAAPVFVNCVFAANTALMGGGIANSVFLPPFSPFEPCEAIITNCTFWNNTAQNGGAISCNQALVTLTNSILWNDTDGEIFSMNANPVISYCNIQTTPGSPPFSGTGNINGTPMFTNPGSMDFHLMPDSPCIDTGINSAPGLPADDFEGDKRTIFCIADIGADEYSSIWAYDTNDNLLIDFPEMVDALMDYLSDCIRYSQMVNALMNYLTSP